MAKQSPSIGRVVHYVLENGDHATAQIIRVWSDHCVNLYVIPDSDEAGPFRVTSRMYDDELLDEEGNRYPNTWHWPEYVPAKEN